MLIRYFSFYLSCFRNMVCYKLVSLKNVRSISTILQKAFFHTRLQCCGAARLVSGSWCQISDISVCLFVVLTALKSNSCVQSPPNSQRPTVLTVNSFHQNIFFSREHFQCQLFTMTSVDSYFFPPKHIQCCEPQIKNPLTCFVLEWLQKFHWLTSENQNHLMSQQHSTVGRWENMGGLLL